MNRLLLLLLSLAINPAMADTLYKCTEKGSESVLFTNQKVGGKQCVVVSQGSSGDGSSNNKPRAASTPTPTDFPRVAPDTQRARDGNRRTILEQELANEQKGLDEARKANNTNKVQLHERNIASLQKELANLK